MRSIWSGLISFGLINIPVKLYSAIESKEKINFHFLHKKDLSPIRYAKVCEADGKEISYKDVVRGYEYEKEHYVVVEEEDFNKANIRETNTIDILSFTNEDEIDSILFEKPYYLEPDKGAEKPYALLTEALKKSHKVGVAKFVIRKREHLGLIKPSENLLILEQMRFQEELRVAEELKIPDPKLAKKQEIDLALQLIKQLTSKFKPEQYKDTYTEELKKVIESKIKGKPKVSKGKKPQPIKTRDLMQILKASLKKEQTPHKR